MKKKGKSKVKNKELESSITNKFMEAIHGLGHDAEKLKKEIAKAGKSVSQKINSALKDAQKAVTKTNVKKDKTAKKDGKKKEDVKTKVVKAAAKAEKVVTAASKAAANKVSTVSSRSVPKPAAPAIDKASVTPPEKEVVKEAPAQTAAPAKRKRAPRRTKEELEAAKTEEKAPVKEASAPVKRKRAPRKPAAVNPNKENPAAEPIGSAVL
jgi:hypothetical protein